MHVLMLAERLPPAIGGVERHVAGLTHELIQRGSQVTLVAPAHAPHLPQEEQLDGARVLRLPCSVMCRQPNARRTKQDYVRAWHWWAEHRTVLDEADIMHFHEVYALLHWFGPARLFCPGKRCYLTYHGYEMRYPIPHRAKLYRWLAAQWVRGSICVGHYLLKWFHLRPQDVTYGAVTLPQQTPALPKAPHAVFIGRLAADTGLDIYLRGLALLKQRYHFTLPLTVCGDGPLRTEWQHLAMNEGIDATFVGFVPESAPYLSQASIAFVSSYLAMLEAMAYRRPVLSVYHTPVKADYLRMIPEADRIIAIAEDPEEVATQLAALLSGRHDPSDQVERAYQFAASHTWARLAEMYMRLWEGT